MGRSPILLLALLVAGSWAAPQQGTSEAPTFPTDLPSGCPTAWPHHPTGTHSRHHHTGTPHGGHPTDFPSGTPTPGAGHHHHHHHHWPSHCGPPPPGFPTGSDAFPTPTGTPRAHHKHKHTGFETRTK